MSDTPHDFAQLFDRLEDLGGEDAKFSPRTLDRFRLGQTLGSGRFAVVVAAEDPHLNRQVALKIPHRDLQIDMRSRDRFVREAQAVARFDHPGIVPLLEVVRMEEGIACLVLGRVNGPTLEQWLEAQGGEVPIKTACQIVASLADAIQHAHEHRVLHLDLKPSNVLIAPGNEPVPEVGQPRVTDFGLARLLDGDRKSSVDRAGSEGYMAPEQAIDKTRDDLTPAADVWALGVILYELLAKRLPFKNNLDLANPEVDPTPLRVLRPDVGRELEAVVLKCLEKKPEGRYASAAELAQDLRATLEGRPTKARPLNQIERLVKKARRKPTEAMLATLVLLALIVGPVGIVLHIEERKEKQAKADLADSLEREKKLETARAAEAEYASLIDRVRRRLVDRPTGWITDNLLDLKRALAFGLPGKDMAGIRSDLAMTLGGSEWKLEATLDCTGRIERVAYSPDGKILALGESGFGEEAYFTIYFFDAITKQPIGKRNISKQKVNPEPGSSSTAEGVWCLKFSRDSRYLFVGTRSGIIHQLNVDIKTSNYSFVKSWRAHTYRTTCLETSEDGKYLFSSSRIDGSIVTWDIHHPSKQIAARIFVSKDATFLPYYYQLICRNGILIAISNTIGAIFLHPETLVEISDLEMTQALGLQPGEAVDIASGLLAVSDNGIGVSLFHNSLQFWDTDHLIESGIFINSLAPQHDENASRAISVDSNGRNVACDFSIGIWLWEAASGQITAILNSPDADGFSREVVFLPDGSQLAIPGSQVLVYKKAASIVRDIVGIQAKVIRRFSLSGKEIDFLAHAPHPTRSTLVLSSENLTGSEKRKYYSHPSNYGNPLYEMVVSLDGKWVAICHGQVIRLVKRDGINNISEIGFHGINSEGNQSIIFANYGEKFYYTSGKSIRRVNLKSPHETRDILWERDHKDNSDGQYWCIGILGDIIAAGNRDGYVDFLHPDADHFYYSLLIDTNKRSPITTLQINGDKKVAVGTSSGKLAIVDAEACQVVNLWDGHPNQRVTSVSLNPDATLLASGGNDGKLHIWRRIEDKWELYFDIPTDKKPVKQVQFDEAGKKLYYLLSGERGVRVWDMERFQAEMKDYGLE